MMTLYQADNGDYNSDNDDGNDNKNDDNDGGMEDAINNSDELHSCDMFLCHI